MCKGTRPHWSQRLWPCLPPFVLFICCLLYTVHMHARRSFSHCVADPSGEAARSQPTSVVSKQEGQPYTKRDTQIHKYIHIISQTVPSRYWPVLLERYTLPTLDFYSLRLSPETRQQLPPARSRRARRQGYQLPPTYVGRCNTLPVPGATPEGGCVCTAQAAPAGWARYPPCPVPAVGAAQGRTAEGDDIVELALPERPREDIIYEKAGKGRDGEGFQRQPVITVLRHTYTQIHIHQYHLRWGGRSEGGCRRLHLPTSCPTCVSGPVPVSPPPPGGGRLSR